MVAIQCMLPSVGCAITNELHDKLHALAQSAPAWLAQDVSLCNLGLATVPALVLTLCGQLITLNLVDSNGIRELRHLPR